MARAGRHTADHSAFGARPGTRPARPPDNAVDRRPKLLGA